MHPNIHKMLLEKQENDTVLGLKTLLGDFGLQVRALRNSIMQRIEEVERTGGDFSELFPLISGERARQVWKDGNAEEAMLTVGQSVGRIHDIPSVAELVERIVAGAREVLRTNLGRVAE